MVDKYVSEEKSAMNLGTTLGCDILLSEEKYMILGCVMNRQGKSY